MGSLFDEIQQRAEKLNTDVRLGDISEFRIQTMLSSNNGKSIGTTSTLDAGLDDIFQRSEEIWNKKQSLRPVAGMSASLRASKDLGQLNSTRIIPPTIQQPTKELSTERPMEYEGVNKDMIDGKFTDPEVNKYVQRAFERARIEAERIFLNQQILERPQSSAASTTIFTPRREESQPLGKGMKHFANLASKSLPHEQNVFAQKIDSFLNTDCKALINTAIKHSIKKLNTKETSYIWSKIFSIFPQAMMLRTDETVREFRSAKRWLDRIIEEATQYLQNELENYMEITIEENLEKARRGGIPGTLSRVEAFLNVKKPSYPIYEDGKYGSHPKWTVLFYCLRLGDLTAVSKIAAELYNNSQCSALVGILSKLLNLKSIEEERRIKLRAEWKQNAQNCQDIYKKAVYGLFLGFDCFEANETLEDWLWARLLSCKYALEPTRALRQLQTTICAQHGEKYFVGKGGSYLLYFAVLMLTGQIERAIYVLFKSDSYRVHAIHCALYAYQLKLLLYTDKVSDEILIQDVHEPSICQLNLPRMILLYVKDFELTNINFALNYCFFLKDFQLDSILDSKVSRSVFEAFVSRIVFLSGERSAILGQLNQKGERVPGLIDKFAGDLNISDAIARVAFDTNIQGDSLEACHLYALANRSEDAIKLICCQLSQTISSPSSEQTRKTVECAQWLVKRYDRPNASEENANFASLLLLLDLHTFFLLASEGKHQHAIEILQKLSIIPTDPEDVQASVAQFHLIPEEAHILMPDICAQLMRSIVILHQALPSGSPETILLKHFAKALILYTAMIPYRFPVSTNSLLLQLQSKII